MPRKPTVVHDLPIPFAVFDDDEWFDEYAANTPAQSCPECKGSGHVSRRNDVVLCVTCQGDGEVWPYGEGWLAIDGKARYL